MNWVTDFARKTPYEIGDVMEAFIALKAYGINPTDGSLRTLGDTAASMNKGLMDAVEMMADAQTGEFERLKAFGITVSQAGDKVTLKFRKDGKDMTQTVKKNGSDIQRALMGIFDSRFAGGMDRLSRITDGKWSGIMDRMTINANRVWKGGFGGAINEQLDRIDEAFSRAEKDGSLDRWAKNAGKGIGDFIRTMADADWERIGGDLKGIAGAIRDVAGALSWLDKQRKAIADFQTTAENVSGWAGRLEYTQSGGLKYHAPNWAKPAAPRPSAPARKSPGNNVPFIDASRPQSAPSGKVKVDIELKGAAAQGARTRVSSSSPQVPVTVNAAKRGQAMAAPA